MDLYDRVLVKIETHYVESPNWQELVQRGADDLDVALGESAFRQQNIPQQDLAGDRCVSPRTAADVGGPGHRHAGSRLMKPSPRPPPWPSAASKSVPPRRSSNSSAGRPTASIPIRPTSRPISSARSTSQIEGNFVGLGIELKSHAAELAIVRVISGSPAEQAGLRAGDRILSVNGVSTKNVPTEQAANMLQGEEGTTVALTVAAPEQSPRAIAVRRRRVEVPSVDKTQMLDAAQGIASLRITCFQKTTRRDLEAALWQLHRQGMKSLVIDLRGNPGGLLVAAVEAVELFVDSGVIVSTRGRSAQEDFTYTSHGTSVWRVPLVVMIDQDSASAAEIFAGAIRDHRRGKLVGSRSYGKGSVQGIFPLESSDAGLRLTTAKFYSPNGHPFNRVGVEPDVTIHQAARPIQGAPAAAAHEDLVLNAALDVARRGLQRE